MGSLHRSVEIPPAASAELSLDISRVVARMMSGETVDTSASAAELAARYPTLGMSGEMIEEAISRAAGMVGMIRSAPAEAQAQPVPEAAATSGGLPDPLEAAFSSLDFSSAEPANDDERTDDAADSAAGTETSAEHAVSPELEVASGGILGRGASAFRALFRR